MNQSVQLRAVALVVLVCALLPTPVRAQTPEPATSFAALPDRLPVEARVVLTLASGERVRGRVDAVEDARLSIRGSGGARWLQDHERPWPSRPPAPSAVRSAAGSCAVCWAASSGGRADASLAPQLRVAP